MLLSVHGQRYPNEIKSSQSGKRILIKLTVILVIQISHPLVFLFLLRSHLTRSTPTVPLWSFVKACACVCMMSGGGHACRDAHVEIRGQLQRVTSVRALLGGFWGSNSGHQARTSAFTFRAILAVFLTRSYLFFSWFHSPYFSLIMSEILK